MLHPPERISMYGCRSQTLKLIQLDLGRPCVCTLQHLWYSTQLSSLKGLTTVLLKIMSCRVQIFILTLMKCWRGYSSARLCRIREMGSLIAWQLLAKCVCQPLSPLECVVEGQAAASFHRQALVSYSTRPATTTPASIMGCHIT